jgi:hypothetical protein
MPASEKREQEAATSREYDVDTTQSDRRRDDMCFESPIREYQKTPRYKEMFIEDEAFEISDTESIDLWRAQDGRVDLDLMTPGDEVTVHPGIDALSFLIERATAIRDVLLAEQRSTETP